MAATAENAQQEPARAATQNLIRTGFNPHPSFHGSLFFADAAITALTTLPLVLHRRHSPFLPPVDAFRQIREISSQSTANLHQQKTSSEKTGQ